MATSGVLWTWPPWPPKSATTDLRSYAVKSGVPTVVIQRGNRFSVHPISLL